MIVEKTCVVDLDGTVTRTVPLFRANRAGKLVAAGYQQELDADGTKDVKIRNATRALDLTAVLDIDALAALAGAAFVLSTTLDNRRFNKGDLIQLVYTVTVAGVVAAGETSIDMLIRHAQTGELFDEE